MWLSNGSAVCTNSSWINVFVGGLYLKAETCRKSDFIGQVMQGRSCAVIAEVISTHCTLF